MHSFFLSVLQLLVVVIYIMKSNINCAIFHVENKKGKGTPNNAMFSVTDIPSFSV